MAGGRQRSGSGVDDKGKRIPFRGYQRCEWPFSLSKIGDTSADPLVLIPLALPSRDSSQITANNAPRISHMRTRTSHTYGEAREMPKAGDIYMRKSKREGTTWRKKGRRSKMLREKNEKINLLRLNLPTFGLFGGLASSDDAAAAADNNDNTFFCCSCGERRIKVTTEAIERDRERKKLSQQMIYRTIFIYVYDKRLKIIIKA